MKGWSFISTTEIVSLSAICPDTVILLPETLAKVAKASRAGILRAEKLTIGSSFGASLRVAAIFALSRLGTPTISISFSISFRSFGFLGSSPLNRSPY